MSKGFGGNIGQLMAQAQKMQARLNALKGELEKKRVEAAAGGGMVTATADGNGNLVSVKIDPAVVKPEEIEMLQDLIVAAVGEVQRKAEAAAKEEMSKITGGVSLPGMF